MHAIASQLSPMPNCTGIELLEADSFNLHCFQVDQGGGDEVHGGSSSLSATGEMSGALGVVYERAGKPMR